MMLIVLIPFLLNRLGIHLLSLVRAGLVGSALPMRRFTPPQKSTSVAQPPPRPARRRSSSGTSRRTAATSSSTTRRFTRAGPPRHRRRRHPPVTSTSATRVSAVKPATARVMGIHCTRCPPSPRLPRPSARTNVLSGWGLLRLVCTTAPLSPRARSISGKCAVAAEGGVPKDTCESLCGGPPPPPPPRPTSFNCLVGPSGPTCEGAENGNYTSEPKCLSECHRTWLCKSGECEAVIDGSGVSHRPPTQPTHTCTRAHMHTYSYAIDLAPSFIHACLVLPLPPYLSPG